MHKYSLNLFIKTWTEIERHIMYGAKHERIVDKYFKHGVHILHFTSFPFVYLTIVILCILAFNVQFFKH